MVGDEAVAHLGQPPAQSSGLLDGNTHGAFVQEIKRHLLGGANPPLLIGIRCTRTSITPANRTRSTEIMTGYRVCTKRIINKQSTKPRRSRYIDCRLCRSA